MIKLQSVNREARWQSSLLCGLSRRLYWEALGGGRRECKTCSAWFKILLNNCLSAVEHRVAKSSISLLQKPDRLGGLLCYGMDTDDSDVGNLSTTKTIGWSGHQSSSNHWWRVQRMNESYLYKNQFNVNKNTSLYTWTNKHCRIHDWK